MSDIQNQNLQTSIPNSDSLINKPVQDDKSEFMSDIVCSTTQQQSGSSPETLDQQNNKTKTGNLSSGSIRKKKSKSKSFQSSQQLDQNQNYREEVVLKFQTFILDNPKIATNFEIAIFNKSQLYCYDKKKSSSTHSNIFKNGVYQPFFQKYFEVLDPNNYKYNHDLYQQICNQQLQIWDYVQLEDDKLRPQVWQKIINKKQTEMSKIENDRNLIQGTSFWYICGCCGGNKTTTSKKQTRSADEGETVNVFCNKCGNSWNQY